MQQEKIKGMNEQLDRLGGPAQRMTALALNGFERMTCFQMESLQTYTQLALDQWRDLLEVRDDRSLREFMDKRQQAGERLSRKLGDDAQELAQIGQEWMSQAQCVSEQNMRSMAEAAHNAVEQTREQSERTARSAVETTESSRPSTRRAS